jgi:hypothetical protein
MKTFKFISTLAAMGVLLSACGKYEKNPVPDLNKLRESGKQEVERGPEKERIVTKEVIVEKPKVVVKEQSTIDDKFIIISPDAEMTFVEGIPASFQVRARSLVPGLKIKLTAQGLPEGAVLQNASTENEKDLYSLSWNAPLYTVAANAAVKTVKVKFVAAVTEVPPGFDKKTIEGLVREKEALLLVLRNQTPPSDLTVENLPTEITEGTLTRFSLTVKVPGIDDKAPAKPRLVVSYDGISLSAGNSFLELDGSRHIIADVSRKEAEYLGDSKWKFHLIFDTKNIGVQPPLSPTGVPMPTADSTRVRLSFKVYSPFGSATPEVLKQVKIQLDRPLSSPRFDLSGLGQETLELTPGEKIKLSFFVASNSQGAQLKVETPDLKTLPGSPVLKCEVSQKSPARQDCSLEWPVPCDAKDSDLTQEISVTATASLNGKNSDPVRQVIKTVASKKQSQCKENPQ